MAKLADPQVVRGIIALVITIAIVAAVFTGHSAEAKEILLPLATMAFISIFVGSRPAFPI